MNLSVNEAIEPPSPLERPAPAIAPAVDFMVPVPTSRRVLTFVILTAVACGLGFGLWSLALQLAPQITPSASVASAYVASFPEKSIAVLPFEEDGGKKGAASVAEALQDDIITTLSKVADLRVISSTSVNSYTPARVGNLREIAQSLGAGHILQGRVSRNAAQAKIELVLTDARRGVRLWTLNYERSPDDIFEIRKDVTQRIIAQFHATVSPDEQAAIEQRQNHDLAAYALYVKGKVLVASVSSSQINEKLLQAVDVLSQAVASDPDFYLAWCQLAAAHNYIYFFGFDHTPARLAQAKEVLHKIAKLRPAAGETHLARANFLYRCHLDYNGARVELAHIQRTLPNNSEAFELAGYIDRRQGLWDESSRSLQRAAKLDPRNVFLLQQIGASYQELRQFRSMAATLDRALEIAPGDLDSRLTRAVVEYEWRADTRPLHRLIDSLLAKDPKAGPAFADQWFYLALSERDPAEVRRALAAIPPLGTSTDINFPRSLCEGLAARALGDTAAAHKAFLAARIEAEKTVQEQPGYGPAYTVLGLIDAALGRKEEALREGRRGVEILPVTKDALDGAELLKYLAVIYAWCGEKDLAIQQIAATLRIPSTLNYGNLKLRPCWDSLRGDPRFEKIVADLAPKK